MIDLSSAHSECALVQYIVGNGSACNAMRHCWLAVGDWSTGSPPVGGRGQHPGEHAALLRAEKEDACLGPLETA